MRVLLEKTRDINKILQNSAGNTTVDFNEVADVLSENIGASIYILDRNGKVLGIHILKVGPAT
jgi:transcriptional pleiotropic repressor